MKYKILTIILSIILAFSLGLNFNYPSKVKAQKTEIYAVYEFTGTIEEINEKINKYAEDQYESKIDVYPNTNANGEVVSSTLEVIFEVQE